ncbi:hypothetical protein Tco_0958900, partial [Tanacetum coccineum]
KGKRLKTSTKAAKPAKKKQPKAKGLTVLSEVALTEAEQIKLATKRSKTQFHNSHASGSGADEGTSITPGVTDVPTYESDDEQISWKSSDEEDDDEVAMNDEDDDNDDNNDSDDDDNDDNDDDNNDNDDDDADNQDDDGQDDEYQDDVYEQTNSENDGDDFIHPKFSTHDVEARQDEEGEEMDEEETNEEDEVNDLHRDVNINLEGRDTEMTDAPRTFVQTTQVLEDTHVIITLVNPEDQQQSSSVSPGFVSNMLNPSPNTSIDSLFNLNTESTYLIDVAVTTIDETLLSSATTLPPPPIPLSKHPQQTP